MKEKSTRQANQHSIFIFEFLELKDLLDLIEGPNGEACRKMYADHKQLFDTAPGSAHNHQVWPGGYKDHITQTMNLFRLEYRSYIEFGWYKTLPESERFSESDGLVVLFLHDLEKPFKYTISSDGTLVDNPELSSKQARKTLRSTLIQKYGITLNANQENALLYVECVRDEHYKQGERVDKPLAAFAHACDLKSARVLYNHKGTGEYIEE